MASLVADRKGHVNMWVALAPIDTTLDVSPEFPPFNSHQQYARQRLFLRHANQPGTRCQRARQSVTSQKQDRVGT